jgi:hypothetical protein
MTAVQLGHSWITNKLHEVSDYFRIHGNLDRILENLQDAGYGNKPWVHRVARDATLAQEGMESRFMIEQDKKDPEVARVMKSYASRR